MRDRLDLDEPEEATDQLPPEAPPEDRRLIGWLVRAAHCLLRDNQATAVDEVVGEESKGE